MDEGQIRWYTPEEARALPDPEEVAPHGWMAVPIAPIPVDQPCRLRLRPATLAETIYEYAESPERGY